MEVLWGHKPRSWLCGHRFSSPMCVAVVSENQYYLSLLFADRILLQFNDHFIFSIKYFIRCIVAEKIKLIGILYPFRI